MTDYERETVINYNDGEDTATVYTCCKKLISKLDRLTKKYPEVCKLKRQDIYSKTYSLSKQLVKIETPSTRTR